MPLFQRMPAPGLFIAADQGGIIRVQEQQFKSKPVCLHLIHDFQQPGKGLPASGIYNHGRITARCLAAQFDKFRQQHDRKIIHTEIIQIFQSTKHLGLSSAGHACYNYETILLHEASILPQIQTVQTILKVFITCFPLYRKLIILFANIIA